MKIENDMWDLNCLPALIVGNPYLRPLDIPEPFRPDLLRFIVGETFMPNEKNEIRISENLYKAWLNKLWEKGFDEEVCLKR